MLQDPLVSKVGFGLAFDLQRLCESYPMWRDVFGVAKTVVSR